MWYNVGKIFPSVATRITITNFFRCCHRLFGSIWMVPPNRLSRSLLPHTSSPGPGGTRDTNFIIYVNIYFDTVPHSLHLSRLSPPSLPPFFDPVPRLFTRSFFSLLLTPVGCKPLRPQPIEQAVRFFFFFFWCSRVAW